MNGYKLAESYDETSESGLFWTDGKKVYFRNYVINGADIASFLSYSGYWAHDQKNCYMGDSRLTNADRESFVGLNYAYAKDKNSVWTMGGRIKDADAESFAVCDDGKQYWFPIISRLNGLNGKEFITYTPCGFGKDKNYVYHYDGAGKANICKNAAPDTFVSMNNGYYGFDDCHVFCGRSKLNKADPKSWKIIKDGYYYSKDKLIYYFNRIIKGADAETFEVAGEDPELFDTPFAYYRKLKTQLARDKNNYYFTDYITEKDEWNRLCREDGIEQ